MYYHGQILIILQTKQFTKYFLGMYSKKCLAFKNNYQYETKTKIVSEDTLDTYFLLI